MDQLVLLKVVAVVRRVVLRGSNHLLPIESMHVRTHQLRTVVLGSTGRSARETARTRVGLASRFHVRDFGPFGG